ncbi:hypothetical protein [Flavobacterium litorale]
MYRSQCNNFSERDKCTIC